MFPGLSWALFWWKLWLFFAILKKALESALPKLHSIKRTHGFPDIWQFSQELYNTLRSTLHIFSKPSLPLSPHSCTFQQAPNPIPHVWLLPFQFCDFLQYFTEIPTDHSTFVKSVSCAISQHFFHCGTSCFSVYYKTSQLRASDTRHLKVFDFCVWNELHTLKRGKFICWKLFFSQLWKSDC